MPWTPRLFTVYKMFFFCTIYKVVYHFQLESKWKLTFGVVPAENFREQWNFWKGSPVFPDRIFQMEIHIPFLASKPSLMTVSDLHGCFQEIELIGILCNFCTPSQVLVDTIGRYTINMSTMSANSRLPYQTTYQPNPGWSLGQHVNQQIGWWCWSVCWQIVGRHIDWYATDIQAILHCYLAGGTFFVYPNFCCDIVHAAIFNGLWWLLPVLTINVKV